MDRAALDSALQAGIEHGGWCPRGRRAEDGPIPAFYQLNETASDVYAVRTRLNVERSDGTLILNVGRLAGGTLITRKYAERRAKPWLLALLDQDAAPVEAARWLRRHKLRVLNVAGPRESSRPGIYQQARRYLKQLLELNRQLVRSRKAGSAGN